MTDEAIRELIKQHDGSRAQVISTVARGDYDIVTFGYCGLTTKKCVKRGLNQFGLPFDYMARGAKEAERDMAIRLAHEAEGSDTQ